MSKSDFAVQVSKVLILKDPCSAPVARDSSKHVCEQAALRLSVGWKLQSPTSQTQLVMWILNPGADSSHQKGFLLS